MRPATYNLADEHSKQNEQQVWGLLFVLKAKMLHMQLMIIPEKDNDRFLVDSDFP